MHSTVYVYCVCTTQRPVHIHCTDNCNGKIQIHCDIMFSNMLPIPCAYDCIYVVHSTSLRIKHFHGTIMHIVIMHVVHHIQMFFFVLQFALNLVHLVHLVKLTLSTLFTLQFIHCSLCLSNMSFKSSANVYIAHCCTISLSYLGCQIDLNTEIQIYE